MLDFLNRCRLKDSKVILCPRGNFVFDKEAAKELDMTNPYQSKKFIRHDKPKELFSNKGKGPKKFQGKTYVPTTYASSREWFRPTRKQTTDGEK